MLFFCFVGYSQNTESTILKESDFKVMGDDVKFFKKDIYVIAGNEKKILCPFAYSSTLNEFKGIGVEKINSMLATSYIKPMFKMKNRFTYTPVSIFIYFSDKNNEWVSVIEYTAQNDYGALKNGRYYVSFEKDGEFKNLISM